MLGSIGLSRALRVVSGPRRVEERPGPGVVRTVLGLVAGSSPGTRLPGLPRVGKCAQLVAVRR
jgi:hypothetical protein